jgi:hypothetical protein
MFHFNKPFLSLSILILILHPIAHAESDTTNQQQNQVQQLQNQITDINGRIIALETAKNPASEGISAIRNSKKLEQKSDAATADIRRTANGHGR